MNKKLFAQLILLFFVIQTIGLATGYFFVQYFQQYPQERPGIVSQNPEDVSNSIGLIIWILFTTALMLLAIKYLKGKMLSVLLRVFEAFAIFGASWIVFSVLLVNLAQSISIELAGIAEIVSLLLAVLLVASKNLSKENITVRNVASIFATAGAGAIIGTIFGILPIIVFLVLLALYDYIAVFKTKHMVTLAKAITKKNLAFTYALPTKEHTFELGTGDMVIPLAFAVSVLMDSSTSLPYPIVLLPSIVVLLASIFGLLLTIDYVSKRIGTAVPALPLQTAFMIIAFAIMKLAVF